jgi:Fe-S-cluster containining protein
VPISETEAHALAALVGAMPEPRRTTIQRRFADIRGRLEETGMLDLLQRRAAWTDEEFRQVRNEYLGLGIPCPFLEEESCSIHPDRPVTCREYLVTSPAENCQCPTADSIDLVPLAAKVWTALARFDAPADGARFLRWVPLVLAPEWAKGHSEDGRLRPAPEWLGELFSKMAGKEIQAEAPPIGLGATPERA